VEIAFFMTKYLLSIDQGTTSSRAILFTTQGERYASAQEEFPQYFPQDGWVEHQPNDILQTVLRTCQKVLAENQLSASDIIGIGITNQRETTLVWNKHTGHVIYNAIVWQDRRTSDFCDSIDCVEIRKKVIDKTGLILDAYFSASKINWILTHVQGAREKAEAGQLLFGTVDTFLLWHLTGQKSHKTDATNASRTLLFNIHQQCWDDELLNLFSIPKNMLPEVMDCADEFGVTQSSLFNGEIPILAMAGDQQAALFGQACFEEGMAKCTYGTGAFLMLNTGSKALKSTNRLLTTIAYRLNGKVSYAIEGSIFMAGATIQWLRDELRIIDKACDSENIAKNTTVEHGVFIVPAFTGLGAPYWDPNARAAISGLSRDSGRNEIISAALQSVAFQSKDLQIAMEKDGLRLSLLKVDGGMAENSWLLNFVSDMLSITVKRPEIVETTALGVAYLAGLQAGTFSSMDELSMLWRCEKSFSSEISDEQRNRLYAQWQRAVSKVQN
jgi:glycerol kinase